MFIASPMVNIAEALELSFMDRKGDQIQTVVEEELSTIYYPDDSNDSSLDIQNEFKMIIEDLSVTHNYLTAEQKAKVAVQMLDNPDLDQIQHINGYTIVSLGNIDGNGNLIKSSTKDISLNQPNMASSSSKYLSLPSGSYVVEQGWYTNPRKISSTLWVNYTNWWTVQDHYKANITGTLSIQTQMSISKTVGYEATVGLSYADFVEAGFTAYGSQTITSTISVGRTWDVPAWTKLAVRPYIYTTTDLYEGVYRWRVYDSREHRYYYVYRTYRGENSRLTEKSVRVWSKYNEDFDPTAQSPIPPTKWEW